jgi:hypothetical protein
MGRPAVKFGYACVSHEPQLPSPLWSYRPERLHALLGVRQNLVGLDKVPSVTLEEEACWLLLHPNCDVELVNETGERVTLEAAVTQADGDPEPDEPAAEPEPLAQQGTDDVDHEEDDDDVDGPAPDAPERASDADAPAPIDAVLRPTRRPKSMPAGELVDGVEKWRCAECNGLMDEQDAVLSWSRRVLLCRKDINARKVG